MDKEKKIGVIAIAALCVVFAVVVVMKFTGDDDAAEASAEHSPHVAGKPVVNPKLASGPTQPRYLTAEQLDESSAPDAVLPTTPDDHWRGAELSAQLNTDVSTPNHPTVTELPTSDNRYRGRYAADTGDDAASADSNPFTTRREADEETAATIAPGNDRWAAAGNDSSAGGREVRASPANPLRRDLIEPNRLEAAEMPIESAADTSAGRYSDLRTPSPPAALPQDAAGHIGQLPYDSAVSPPYSAHEVEMVQHAQAQNERYPRQRQPYASAPPQPQEQQPPHDPGQDPPQAPSPVVPETYIVAPNDNYWVISAAVYGTGKYFKALYEHNRHRYPAADDLHVGDSLDVPALEELEELYPELCPKRRRSTRQPRGYAVSSSGAAAGGGQVHVVQEGDTLFNIARDRLGKAALWAELYELNRDVLGDDIDFLSPGMQLVLPDDGGSRRDTITRRGGEPLPR